MSEGGGRGAQLSRQWRRRPHSTRSSARERVRGAQSGKRGRGLRRPPLRAQWRGAHVQGGGAVAVALGHGGGAASAWRTRGHSPEQVAGEGLSTSVAIFEHIP
jgi:hypothetical protein